MSKRLSIDELFKGRHFDGEIIVRVRGRWTYRAVDARGKMIDFRLSPKHDVAAAKAFFRKAFTTQGCMPRTITLDGYQASRRAVHRNIKSRTRPMLGFKQFENAASTLGGVELIHRIRKGQFALGRLRISGTTTLEIWNAVRAA